MLIKCSECSKEFSDKAVACPNCGCPTEIAKGTVTEVESEESKKVCPVCGYENMSDISFCEKCGYNFYSKKTRTENLEVAYNFKKPQPEPKEDYSIIAKVLVGILFFIFLVVIIFKNLADTHRIDERNENLRQELSNSNTVPSSSNNFEKNIEKETEIVEESEEEYKLSCQEYKYKDVLRHPEDYIGKRVVVDLKISTVKKENILNSTKYYFAYSQSDYGWYGDRYAVLDNTDNSLKILEDDIIRVWGEIAEPEDTFSWIVNSEELFAINMKYCELISE